MLLADRPVVKAGAAIELVQIKSPRRPTVAPRELGYEWQERNPVPFEERKFDTLYDGRKIIGTEQAIRNEYRDVLIRVMGPEGDKLRENMCKLRERLEASQASGEAHEAMEALAKYF